MEDVLEVTQCGPGHGHDAFHTNVLPPPMVPPVPLTGAPPQDMHFVDQQPYDNPTIQEPYILRDDSTVVEDQGASSYITQDTFHDKHWADTLSEAKTYETSWPIEGYYDY